MAIVGDAVESVSLDDVKARLNDPSSVNDVELQTILDRALAAYAEWVGPLPGSYSGEYLSGWGTGEVWLPQGATAVSAVAYTDGATIDVADLRVTPAGKLTWLYGTAGYFTRGTDNLIVSYTVGALPGHHVEAIVMDVAGLYASSQRGGSGRQFGQYDAGPEPLAQAGYPMTLFPRIMALAPPRIG